MESDGYLPISTLIGRIPSLSCAKYDLSFRDKFNFI